MFYCFMCTMKPLGNYIEVSWLSINDREGYIYTKTKRDKGNGNDDVRKAYYHDIVWLLTFLKEAYLAIIKVN